MRGSKQSGLKAETSTHVFTITITRINNFARSGFITLFTKTGNSETKANIPII